MDYDTLCRILDHSPDGNFIWDKNTVLVYANKAALEQNMVNKEEFIGHTWEELKENDHIFGGFVPLAFQEKRIMHAKSVGPSGREKYITNTPVLDADGNVTLTDGEETYAFPVKSAGYVKLCDDEDLFG